MVVMCHCLCPWQPQPRKVEMKTLVSKLSVACHQRSGKYRTCRRHQWAPTALAGKPGLPCRACTHLPGAQGALQWALGWWQGGIRVLEPGQSRLVGVEVRGFIRRIQKPALENTIPSQFPCSPSGSAPWGLPYAQLGACFSPSSPNPSPKAQFSPSCRKSPRRNQGRASGREHQSLSLRSQSCRQGWCPGCGKEGARSAGTGGPTR